MSAAARRGISLHEDAFLIESLTQRFQRPFYRMTKSEALRCAIYTAIRNHGVPHQEAWEDSGEEAAKWRDNGMTPEQQSKQDRRAGTDKKVEAIRWAYDRQCKACGSKPIVQQTGMCGPCTFGTADSIPD